MRDNNEQNEALLTIIIPHYNTPQKLRNLLETIPVNRKEIQIIVVDDNSNEDRDCLMELGKEYSKQGVFFYANKSVRHNAGAARNIGIKHAKGKWILFADADDFFVEGFDRIIADTDKDEADVVFFVPTSVKEGTSIKSWRHLQIESIINDYLRDSSRKNELRVRYNITSPCSKLIRKQLLIENKIWFDEVEVANDVMFSMKLSYYARNIKVSDHVIYCITENSSNITSRKGTDVLRTKMEVGLRQRLFLKNNLNRTDWKLLGMNADGLVMDAIHKNYNFGLILTWIIRYVEAGFLPLSKVGFIELVKAELFRIPEMKKIYYNVRNVIIPEHVKE